MARLFTVSAVSAYDPDSKSGREVNVVLPDLADAPRSRFRGISSGSSLESHVVARAHDFRCGVACIRLWDCARLRSCCKFATALSASTPGSACSVVCSAGKGRVSDGGSFLRASLAQVRPRGPASPCAKVFINFLLGPEQTCVKRQQFCRLGNFRRKLFGALYSFVPGLSHDSRCDSSLALILGGLYHETRGSSAA